MVEPWIERILNSDAGKASPEFAQKLVEAARVAADESEGDDERTTDG